MNLIKLVEKSCNLKEINFPDFNPGDTIAVSLKIKEGSKERIQKFQGTVIRRKNIGSNNETFTVRKVFGGIGVEKIFPAILPTIEQIEVLRYGAVRRSRLYYLRDRQGKSAIVKEKRRVGTKK